MLLALGHDHDGLVLVQLAAPVAVLVDALIIVAARLFARLWQSAAGAGQARGHERGAGQYEADGAAVDTDGREGLGEAVDELEMREEGALVDLEEDGLAVDDVEGCAVGELHLLEGGFLGEDLVDVGG